MSSSAGVFSEAMYSPSSSRLWATASPNVSNSFRASLTSVR